MEQTDEEFFHDFRQELLAGAEANGSFQLSEFMEAIANDLVETGFTEGFELCHFRAQRGMRVTATGSMTKEFWTSSSRTSTPETS